MRPAEPAGIYIHIPFCKARCGYCSFVSGCDIGLADEYIQAISSDLLTHRDKQIPADTLYIGGGTPTVLPASVLAALIGAARTAFSFAVDSEVTVECNPDSVQHGMFDVLAAAGVNRISMGLQDMDDAVVAAAGRQTRFADFVRALSAARQAGLTNISSDVILGLPGQTLNHVSRTVEYLIGEGIPHLSAYALLLEPGSALHQNGYVPDSDLQADMYDAVLDAAVKAGYRRYEVSNFALPGYESRHNLKYWHHVPYYGFGAGAHSFYDGVRYAAESDIYRYLSGETGDAVPIGTDELREEYLMLRLRTALGIILSDYTMRFGRSLQAEKGEQVERLKALGLISVLDGRLFATDKGFYILNQILLALL